MILQALTQYYEDLEKQGKIARPGWAKTKISYALCINERGELEQVIPLLEETEGKKPQPRQFDLPAPVSRHGKVILPNFLWDSSAYLLGIDIKKPISQTQEYFKHSRMLHRKMLNDVDSKVARAIIAFFDSWEPLAADSHPILKDEYFNITQGVNLLFRVDGVFAHDEILIQNVWQQHFASLMEEGIQQQCLISGKLEPIARTHPEIHGLPGASNPVLVGFNEDAFCSYGKVQNFNAPVGKHAAFAYTAALNFLLIDRKNVYKIGDTTIVCWAEGAEPQYQLLTCAALFDSRQLKIEEGDIRNAVKRLANAKPCIEWSIIPEKEFYILGIAALCPGRVTVRFFYRNTFGKLMANINKHYNRLKIISPITQCESRIIYPSTLLEKIQGSQNKAGKKMGSDVINKLSRELVDSIIFNRPYPSQIVAYTRSKVIRDAVVDYYRAAILKANLIKNNIIEEGTMEAYDENCNDIAYILGAFFAICEEAQRLANPEVKATVHDRYFLLSINSPSVAFRQLSKLADVYIRQGKRTNSRKANYLNNEIKRLLIKIPAEEAPIPHLFTPNQKDLFIIGYYHRKNWVGNKVNNIETKGDN